MEFKLTRDQQKFFDLIVRTRDNYLLTGPPGSGKSVITRALMQYAIAKKMVFHLCAPTGLAALNIGGRTLHSLFYLPVSKGITPLDFNRWPESQDTINNIRYNVQTLVIDEISMVRADTIDFIDRLMQYCKRSLQPFGGAQVIWVGDYYQLPPVCQDNDIFDLKTHGWKSPFAFDSKVFKSGGFKTLALTEVLRQKGDLEFINILGRARIGAVTKNDLKILNTQVGKPKDLCIQLMGTNRMAAEVNKRFLDAIDSEPFYYSAKIWGKWGVFPCEEELELKVGAQVMVKKNGADQKNGNKEEHNADIVNGTFATILTCHKDHVDVRTDKGKEVSIYIQKFELKIKELKGKKWQEKIVASFTQIPLILAWAVSIHKSQGQTFDRVHVDAKKIFEAGQLYVALSRCRTRKGISLEAPLTAAKFYANRHVERFYNEQ